MGSPLHLHDASLLLANDQSRKRCLLFSSWKSRSKTAKATLFCSDLLVQLKSRRSVSSPGVFFIKDSRILNFWAYYAENFDKVCCKTNRRGRVKGMRVHTCESEILTATESPESWLLTNGVKTIHTIWMHKCSLSSFMSCTDEFSIVLCVRSTTESLMWINLSRNSHCE